MNHEILDWSGFTCGILRLCFSSEENATGVRSGRVSEPMRERARSQRNDSPFCKTPHNFPRVLDRNAQLQVRAPFLQLLKQQLFRLLNSSALWYRDVYEAQKREERLWAFSCVRSLTRVAMTIKERSDQNQNVTSNSNSNSCGSMKIPFYFCDSLCRGKGIYLRNFSGT